MAEQATDDLRAAAQAVVDRWDTPTWKDAPATAEYINRLRAALAAPAQAATAKQSPHPEYDKGFSDGWNRCEERQAAAPAQAGEYPELPIRYATYDAWGNQTKHGYNAKDMHAYVDADRAARGAAQAAPEDASARFKAQHEFLIWNREQTPPPIESATEYSVFNQAVDFYIAARATQKGSND